MEGKTVRAIALELTEDGIPTPAGKETWRASSVLSILKNEKYRGSALLQKRFTVDYLTKKKKWNEGEVPQYYVEHSHEAIIDPLEWDAVQEELARRKAIGQAYSGHGIFSAKIKCGDCGSWYGRKTWHSDMPYMTRVMQCNGKYKKDKPLCQTPALREEEIKTRFVAAFNSIILDKTPYLNACTAAKKALTDTSSIDQEMDELRREMEIITGLTEKLVSENASMVQSQDEYVTRYNAYVERYEKAKNRHEELAKLQRERKMKGRAIDRFINTLREREELLIEFDEHLWFAVVEYAMVYRDGSITFHFFDGTEVTK